MIVKLRLVYHAETTHLTSNGWWSLRRGTSRAVACALMLEAEFLQTTVGT